MLLWGKVEQTKPNGHWRHGSNSRNTHINKKCAKNIFYCFKKAFPLPAIPCLLLFKQFLRNSITSFLKRQEVVNSNVQPHGRLTSVAQNESLQRDWPEEKEGKGNIPLSQSTVCAQQVNGDKVSLAENHWSIHLIEISFIQTIYFIDLLSTFTHFSKC